MAVLVKADRPKMTFPAGWELVRTLPVTLPPSWQAMLSVFFSFKAILTGPIPVSGCPGSSATTYQLSACHGDIQAVFAVGKRVRYYF